MDLIGTVLTALIVIGAIGFALVKAYKFLQKEGLVGRKEKMWNTQESLPTWEEGKYYALHRGKLSIKELDKKYEEGWGLVAFEFTDNYYYYFIRAR